MLKAPDRPNISETNLLSVRENRIGSEEITPRIIITPKRYLSQVKVCIILQDKIINIFYLQYIFVQ